MLDRPKIKYELNKTETLISKLLLSFNAFSFFAIPFFSIISEEGLNNVRSILAGIFFLILTVINLSTFLAGIILGYVYTFKRKVSKLAIILLVVSFLSFPFIGPALLTNCQLFRNLISLI